VPTSIGADSVLDLAVLMGVQLTPLSPNLCFPDEVGGSSFPSHFWRVGLTTGNTCLLRYRGDQERTQQKHHARSSVILAYLRFDSSRMAGPHSGAPPPSMATVPWLTEASLSTFCSPPNRLQDSPPCLQCMMIWGVLGLTFPTTDLPQVVGPTETLDLPKTKRSPSAELPLQSSCPFRPSRPCLDL
jgi:hypothetical protein